MWRTRLPLNPSNVPCLVSLQVKPSLPFSPASTDLLYVNRHLPRLRLPTGVQYRAGRSSPFYVGQFNHDVFLVTFLPYTFVADLHGPSDP